MKEKGKSGKMENPSTFYLLSIFNRMDDMVKGAG